MKALQATKGVDPTWLDAPLVGQNEIGPH